MTATRRNCLDLCDHAPNAVLRAPPAAAAPHTRLDTFPRLLALVAHAYNGDTEASNVTDHPSDGESGSNLRLGPASGKSATQTTAATAPGHSTNPFTASLDGAARRQSSEGLRSGTLPTRQLPLQARVLACCELRWQSSISFGRGDYANAASKAARARAVLGNDRDPSSSEGSVVASALQLPLPEQPPCAEGRAGPGLSDADDSIASQAATLKATAKDTNGTLQAPPMTPPPNDENDYYLLLRLKCWVSEGSARLALDEGEAALACADTAIAVVTEATKPNECNGRSSASADLMAAASDAVIKNDGLYQGVHIPAEPWVLRADALLFLDLGFKRSSSSLAWAPTSNGRNCTASRALDGYRAALARAESLRAVGAPRHLRLPFDESRRIKQRIKELSELP